MGNPVKDWRRAWLRHYLESRFEGNQSKLAAAIGRDPSYISQLLSADDAVGHRNMGDQSARAIEDQLGLTHGAFDRPLDSERSIQEPEPAPFTNPNRHKVPLISGVSAGPWDAAFDPYAPGAAEDWIETNERVSRRAFALRVKGESMQAPVGAEYSFPPGTIIIVDPGIMHESGDFVVVRNNDWDEATFKRYVVDGGLKLLQPLNKEFPTMQMAAETVLCGVVVEQIFRKSIRRRR